MVLLAVLQILLSLEMATFIVFISLLFSDLGMWFSFMVVEGQYILDRHSNLNLLVDVMHVNETMFLVTVCKPIEYVTAQVIRSEKINDLKKSLDGVIRMYNQRSFNIARTDAELFTEP